MRSLITGGAGFIGSHLAEHLLDAGEEVVVLDNLSTGQFNNIRSLVGRAGFTYFIGDVEDRELLNEAARDADAIYHLAAAVGVELIVRDPVRTIETNVGGTQAVLHQAVRYGKQVLVASTSEVYGKGMRTPFAEDDDVVYGPTSRSRWAYAVSKAIDEFLVKAYYGTKGLPGVVVRLFNTVGPRQVGQYGMVIPRFVSQALRGGPITVYGDGRQQRCFSHVADVVPALRKIMHLPEARGQVINLGDDRPITIGDLAELVRKKFCPSAEIRVVPYDVAYGPGFEAKTLDNILDDVGEWLKSAGELASEWHAI
jgi:UDP-glucose 4-epimerase